MKVIRNNIVPFKGFAAINLFGVLFVRKGAKITDRMMRHESIHSAQMREMLYLFFYLWYVTEWIIRLFMKGNAYRNISFEREAYNNEHIKGYTDIREPYEWIKYLKNKIK